VYGNFSLSHSAGVQLPQAKLTGLFLACCFLS
jgi:hypothetical protein